MRLRRFLMTEPTSPPLLDVLADGHAYANAPPAAGHMPTPKTTAAAGRGRIAAGKAASRERVSLRPARRPGARRRQVVPTNASLRYWFTACSGTRKERPTRIASSSPESTRRYTVILETRIIKATSATVRNLTSLRGVSLAIELPLPYEAEHLTGFGAPVTYVSRVSPAQKRATPCIASLLLLFGRYDHGGSGKISVPCR